MQEEMPHSSNVPTANDLETLLSQFQQERSAKATIIQLWLDNYQQIYKTMYGIDNMPLSIEQSIHMIGVVRTMILGDRELSINIYPKKPSSWAEGAIGGNILWRGSRVFETGLVMLDKENVMILSVQRHLLGFSSRKLASEALRNDPQGLTEYQAGEELFRKFRKSSTPSPEAFALAAIAHMFIDVNNFWLPTEQYQIHKTRADILAAKIREEDTTLLEAKLEMLIQRTNFVRQLGRLGISEADFIQGSSRGQMFGVPGKILREKTESLISRV